MTPPTTEAAGAPARAPGWFWAGLAVLALVVVAGSLGASRGGPGPWATGPGPAWRGPAVGAPRALDLWGLVLALVPVAGLALARRPGRMAVAGCAAAVAALGTYLLAGYPFGPVFLPVVACVLVVASSGRRVLAWTTAAALAASAAVALARRDALDVPVLLGVAPWFVVLVLVGEALRFRAERREAARAAQAVRLQSLVATERLGIARDLHDVLAHSLSAINVQAGVGLHLMDGDPAQARAALQAVKDTSKQALDEVRGVIGALRGDGDAPRRPTPGIADVASLVEEATATGMRVRLDLRGPDDDAAVAPHVGAAVYRIVQESLTNVRRHAARAEASVSVVVEARAVVVEVHSPRAPATGTPVGPGGPGGHGIAGMRERAAALGGRLDAGPEGDEFVVRAELPLAVRR